MTTEPPRPGWYPDPNGPADVQRYWDGTAWTQHTHTGPIGMPTPASASAPPLYGSASVSGSGLATYGRRLGGWLIDWVILGVASSIILIPLGGLFHSGWGFLVSAVLVIGYGTILCGSERGQTFGMMVVGVRAVDHLAGTPIGHRRAFGRALLEYVLALAFFLPWVLDMLWPLWDGRNQTLHDKASQTIVVYG